MNSPWKALSSSIGKKWIIGITGFLLIGFLLTHLAGNLLLYIGPEVYDHYAETLHSNPLLPLAEIALLILFILHIFLAIDVSRKNRRARAQGYQVKKSKQGRSAANPSSIMLVSGIIILGFVLLHLADMRFELRFDEGTSAAERTLRVLQDPISSIVYFLGSIFVGYHLAHAFQSVFQTFGFNSERYTPKLKKIGLVLAIVLGIGFASFPIWGFLTRMGVITR